MIRPYSLLHTLYSILSTLILPKILFEINDFLLDAL